VRRISTGCPPRRRRRLGGEIRPARGPAPLAYAGAALAVFVAAMLAVLARARIHQRRPR